VAHGTGRPVRCGRIAYQPPAGPGRAAESSTGRLHGEQWGAEKKNQIDYYDSRFPGTDLKNPSFAGIARSMGADGTTISGPGEVGDALRAATASGRPTVLENMVNQELGEPFRRDALRKPTRLLAKYASYTR
jgi:sulfoacetaldehyde acetyltransferase